MTAHAMAGDEQKSMEAGMNGHVTKPIDPDQLFSTLQKWIKPIEKGVQIQQAAVSVEQTESDKAIPAEDELPESLAGFDLADGLKRLQGNKKLYRKLLLSFATDYNAVANEIRQALDEEDFDQIHTFFNRRNSVEDKFRIGISSCLLGNEERWNAGHKLDKYLTLTLGKFVEYVPVCPEVEIGLGIPRESMRLVGDPENPRLIILKSKMIGFAYY